MTAVRRSTAVVVAALIGTVGAAACSEDARPAPRPTRTGATSTPGIAAVAVALDPLSELHTDAGQVVVRGRWGPGLGEFGLSRPSRRGPTSFDVTADGAVVVVDQENHRVVLHEPGSDSAVVTGLRPISYDVAVDDGVVHLLAINGGRAGADLLSSLDIGDGSLIESTSLGDDAARTRVVAGELYVNSLWGGWRLAENEAPVPPGIPTERGGQIRLGGGRGRSVTITKTETGSTTSWGLTGAENLGVVAVTATADGVRAVLVRWTDTSRSYQYVELGPTGVLETFAMPDRAFAEMTAGSEFRFHDGSLYRAESTSRGFAIYRHGSADAPCADAVARPLASLW